MEEKQVTTNAINENIILSKYMLFEWRCEKKENIGRKVIFTFSRDNEKPYYKELVKLEEEFGNYKIGTMIPSYVLSILAFLLITAFFILYLVDKSNVLIYFLAVSLPGLLCLLGAVGFTIFRFIGINKIDKEMPDKIKLYVDRIKDLKSKS